VAAPKGGLNAWLHQDSGTNHRTKHPRVSEGDPHSHGKMLRVCVKAGGVSPHTPSWAKLSQCQHETALCSHV
jgi:hypothetical protein